MAQQCHRMTAETCCSCKHDSQLLTCVCKMGFVFGMNDAAMRRGVDDPNGSVKLRATFSWSPLWLACAGSDSCGTFTMGQCKATQSLGQPFECLNPVGVGFPCPIA